MVQKNTKSTYKSLDMLSSNLIKGFVSVGYVMK